MACFSYSISIWIKFLKCVETGEVFSSHRSISCILSGQNRKMHVCVCVWIWNVKKHTYGTWHLYLEKPCVLQYIHCFEIFAINERFGEKGPFVSLQCEAPKDRREVCGKNNKHRHFVREARSPLLASPSWIQCFFLSIRCLCQTPRYPWS